MQAINQYFTYLRGNNRPVVLKLRSLWKIVSIAAIAFTILGPLPAEARKRHKHAYANSDITQCPRYSSLIVNSSTGEVLHRHNADVQRHPASLTKMMTTYIAFQAIKSKRLSFNSQLPVSSWAALPSRSPTKLWLKAGQTISVRDTLNGIIIHSANDAAVVMAEAISGSEEAFADKMTQTAHQLGMRDTIFTNSHGLHDRDQVTTAFDMAKLGIALRRDFPEFYPMFSKKSFVYRGTVINGHNRVLARYRWADGLKTGYIAASGFNLVTSASRPEGKIVAVVLGGPTAAMRDNHMISLLDKGFYKLTGGKSGANITVAQDTPPTANAFEVASIDTTQQKVKYTLNKSAFDALPTASVSKKTTVRPKVTQVKLASKTNKQVKLATSKSQPTKNTKAVAYLNTSKNVVQATNKKKSPGAMNIAKSKRIATKAKSRKNITN